MTKSIRFVLVLHNHQPIGNFDHVFEQAYQDSYLPFLDLLEEYPSLPVCLHTSGSLMEWLDRQHPEYVDRLAKLAKLGRIEVLGGPFYEPILTMIPRRDRIGQITAYTRWLQERLHARIRGMWVPERVWEQALASDLAAAGIEYTVLDDYHFRNASLRQDELHGYYVTEDDGRVLAVFPGSERLRYTIPFEDPQATIDYLRGIARSHPGSVAVFGDDGEKFGTWPGTKKHVYTDGWLRRFFDALVENEDWIDVTTLGEAVDQVPPTGKIYLPNCSYREMTEWSLTTPQLTEYERLRGELQHRPDWESLATFMRGGFWRNFKLKYPESDEMYARMLMVSNSLAAMDRAAAEGRVIDQRTLETARTHLYRAQCNCSFWHGAFGGIYLPHLRNAVYANLIAAENLLLTLDEDAPASHGEPWVEATATDLNLDARQEVLLTGDKLAAMFSPHRGGQMYELDVRSICHNLLATLSRRPEAYHRKMLAAAGGQGADLTSIHERVVLKQEGLVEKLQYDNYSRKSLLDHFFDNDTSLGAIVRGEAMERGDFLTGSYEARLRRNPNRIQVQLVREGNAWGIPLAITKGVTLQAGSNTLEIAYLIEGLPPRRAFHFAVEFNFAGLPAGIDDRYFHDGKRQRLGRLGERLDLVGQERLHLVDEYLGIDVGLQIARPSHIWSFPIATVSGSEGGIELVHQSVVVMPHWTVEGDSAGRWSVTMQLTCDTRMAESRRESRAHASLAR